MNKADKLEKKQDSRTRKYLHKQYKRDKEFRDLVNEVNKLFNKE